MPVFKIALLLCPAGV